MHLIPDLLERIADLQPLAPAMRDLISGRRVDYRTFDDRAARAASLFGAMGVNAGDRVGILCRNRIEFFEALFACARIGAIATPLNWRMPAAELQGILDASEPSLVLSGAEDADKIASEQPFSIINFDDDGPSGWNARIAAAARREGRPFWPGADIWYLLYTSGTTGKPKAVIQTYQMALANYVAAAQAIGLARGQRTLNFLPLFHTAGVNLFTLPFLFEGGEVAVLPGFDADRVMALLEEGLDAFFGVPAVYLELSLHPKFPMADLSRVGSWVCGGAPLSDALVRTFAARGARVCNGYGMTETGPTTFLVDPEHAERKIGSVGKPRLMTRARIVDAAGAPAKTGETGEMQLKGPSITPGYWNAPAETKAAFTDDGWLKTGDLASMDDEGFVYIVGRSKEMYISGGENVYPAEVENVYAAHPEVLEAAIIGVPDAKWGEVGRAFILPRPGVTPQTDELVRFGRERLAAYKVPKSFIIVSDFPRTAAGKVQKHLLPKAD